MSVQNRNPHAGSVWSVTNTSYMSWEELELRDRYDPQWQEEIGYDAYLASQGHKPSMAFMERVQSSNASSENHRKATVPPVTAPRKSRKKKWYEKMKWYKKWMGIYEK